MKQEIYSFVIKINNYENFIDIDIDLNKIDEIKRVTKIDVNFEKRDDFVIVFEFIIIIFFRNFRCNKNCVWQIDIIFLFTKRCVNVLLNILSCKRTCSWFLIFDINFFSQYLHMKTLLHFFWAWVKNYDIDEKWITHSKYLYYRDEKKIIIESKLIIKENKNVMTKTFL